MHCKLVDNFSIPQSWRVDRSLDWGFKRPFSVAWWAESDGSDLIFPNGSSMHTVSGDLFRYQELYGKGLPLPPEEIAERIQSMELGMGIRVQSGLADPSIFCKPGDRSSIASVASRMPGVTWEPALTSCAGGRRKSTVMLRHKLLSAMAREYGSEVPGLFVVRSCEAFIRTLPSLWYAEDIPVDCEDHALDDARYRVLGYEGVAV